MYNIWFERGVPEQYVHMFEDIANGISPEGMIDKDRLHQIDIAHGIMAGGVVYNAELMDKAPNLLIICRIGIGYDRVDIAAATEHGIAVCNTPDGPTISTAECAITLMMTVTRSIKSVSGALEDMLKSGEKRNIWGEYRALEMYGKNLGLVGLGRIGGHVSKIANAIGMKVTTYDPFVSEERLQELNVSKADSLEELLGNSDIVSLHLPLNPDTHKIMNAERFAQMKEGAIFVNVSRGGHVDEDALADALDSGHIFGAGLDVTDPEPPLAGNRLLNRPNVVITPHIASATPDGRRKMMTKAMDQILQVLRGEKPDNLINPEVWDTVKTRWEAMQ
jgi:D-3-phosphoglycerate dehydrogenase